MPTIHENKIPFWNNEYMFDAPRFASTIDELMGHNESERLAFEAGPSDEDLNGDEIAAYEKNLSKEQIEDRNNEGYYSFVVGSQLQCKLVTLSKRTEITKNTKKELENLWTQLEKKNALVFVTPWLRKKAEEKLNLQTVSLSDEFFMGELPRDVDDGLLLKYLSNDLQLMRSSLVVEYIKYEQQIQDSIFLRKLSKIICPKGINQRGQKKSPLRFVIDWVFAQIYFYQNIDLLPGKSIRDRRGMKEFLDKIQEEFPKIIGRLPGLKNDSPSLKTLRSWYYSTKKEYEGCLAPKDLITMIHSHLTEVPRNHESI